MQRQLGLFAAALTLPILAFVAFVFWQVAIGERARLEAEAADAAKSLALTVDRDLNGLRAALRVLSLSVHLQNGDIEAFHAQANQIEIRQAYNTVLRDLDGQQLANTRVPYGTPLPETPVDSDADSVASGETYITNLYRGPVAQEPVFSIGVPVYRGDEPIYLLSLSSEATRLLELLIEADLPERWTAAIIDRQDRIMARNRNHEEFVGELATDDLRRNTGGSQGTWMGTTKEGEAIFGAYARSTLSGWRVVIGLPQSEINAPVRRTLVFIALSGLASLALSLILAWHFGRRIAAPVHALSQRAEALGRGQSVAPLHSPVAELDSVGAALAQAGRQLAARQGQLRESEAKFRAIADAMPQMVWSTKADGQHDYYNARWYEFTGLPPGAPHGKEWSGLFHADDVKRAGSRWQHSLRTGEPYETEYRLRHHSGEYRWTLARALPIRDEDGRISRWFGTSTDIHERKQRIEELRIAQLRLQLAVEAASIGVWEYEVAADRVIWDQRIRERTAREGETEHFYSQHFLPIVHEDDRAAVDAAIQATAADGRELSIEYRIRTPKEEGDIWVSTAGLRLIGDDGRVRVIGTARNITEERRALAEREVIAQELSHRIKNIFSVISGMIGLSARTYPETRALAEQLRARIAALGRAHDFVRPHDVSLRPYAGPSTLSGLATALLAPYENEGQGHHFTVSGDDIEVDDRAATPLALLFHELATNAAKYGALSRPGGRIAMTIAVDADTVTVDWQEEGGPELDATPENKGFGSRLTTLSVELQLSGTIDHRWEASGLHCVIRIPTRSFTRNAAAA